MAIVPQRGTQPVRVVLVDRRVERRELMRHLVEAADPGTVVVAEVGGGDESDAAETVVSTQADVVILEIQLPVDAGLAAIAALRSTSASLAIFVCSFHRDAGTKDRAMALGADVYLDKPVSPIQLKAALADRFGAEAAVPGQLHPRPDSGVRHG